MSKQNRRIKPTPYIVENIQEAERALAELAALDRQISESKLAMQAAIDLEKSKASQNCAPLLERRKELENSLAIFAKLHKNTLFTKAKSCNLGFGIIGFRASTQIRLQNGITAAMTLDRLEDLGYHGGIRIKKEINKEFMSDWTNEQLQSVGLKRQHLENFFIEIAHEKMPVTGLEL